MFIGDLATTTGRSELEKRSIVETPMNDSDIHFLLGKIVKIVIVCNLNNRGRDQSGLQFFSQK
jgi:hypothetical protein